MHHEIFCLLLETLIQLYFRIIHVIAIKYYLLKIKKIEKVGEADITLKWNKRH